MFCNRMKDMFLYHIFKLLILLFGCIVMFDTSMFLLSFDTDWAQTTLVENTVPGPGPSLRLNAARRSTAMHGTSLIMHTSASVLHEYLA